MKSLKSSFITKTKESRLYNLPIPVIGLTGGIATGKSTVAKILSQKNIPVIDADKLVKTVYQRQEVFEYIQKEFPEAINQRSIDFKTLRKLAFSNKANIEKIEKKIYQYLPETFLNEFKKLNSPSFVVYDVPLLFEKGLDSLVDQKVCVYANRDLQIKRLVQRDLISHEDAANIIDHQMSIEEKKNRSSIVISNENAENELLVEVENFLKKILET